MTDEQLADTQFLRELRIQSFEPWNASDPLAALRSSEALDRCNPEDSHIFWIDVLFPILFGAILWMALGIGLYLLRGLL